MDLIRQNDKDGLLSQLSSSFNNITNTYKHYWLWSIMELIKDTKRDSLTFLELGTKMLELVWHPLTYYKLSFGKQDSFVKIAEILIKKTDVKLIQNQTSFSDIIKSQDQEFVKKIISNITKYVPYRFLRPFFSIKLKGIRDSSVNLDIKDLANAPESKTMYKFENESIIISPEWMSAILSNYNIVKDFIHRNLISFLTKHNPNVIGISSKLEKPMARNLNQQRKLLKEFILNTGSASCIYSNSILIDVESIDHFIPWSYVVHDHIWNLVPVTKSSNSSKSNCLPNFDSYFKPFVNFQFDLANFTFNSSNHKNFKVAYSSLLSLEFLPSIDVFEKKYDDIFTSLKLNASSIGFVSDWVFER